MMESRLSVLLYDSYVGRKGDKPVQLTYLLYTFMVKITNSGSFTWETLNCKGLKTLKRAPLKGYYKG